MSVIIRALACLMGASAVAAPATAQDNDGLREGAGGLRVIVAIDEEGAPFQLGEEGAVAVFLHPEPMERAFASGEISSRFEGRSVLFGQVLDSGAGQFQFFGSQRDLNAAAELTDNPPNPPLFVVSANREPVFLTDADEREFVPAWTSADQAAALQSREMSQQPDAEVSVAAFPVVAIIGQMQSGEGPPIRVMTHPDTFEWAQSRDAPTQ